jgi:hypothetical protein
MSVYYSTHTVNLRTYQRFGEKAGIYNVHIIQRTQNLLVTHLSVAYYYYHHHHHHERITPIKQEICEQAAHKLLCAQLQQLLLPSLSVLLCLQGHTVGTCLLTCRNGYFVP